MFNLQSFAFCFRQILVISDFQHDLGDTFAEVGLYSSYIKSKQDVLLTNHEAEKIVEAIQTGRLPLTWATHKQHIASLKERNSASTNDLGEPQCPKCGSAMIKRVGKTGAYVGKEFWGCSCYPKCREIVSL